MTDKDNSEECSMYIDDSALEKIISDHKNNDERSCTICHEPLIGPDQNIHPLELVKCPSKNGHLFHTSCYAKWFLEKGRCPLCNSYSLAAQKEFCQLCIKEIPKSNRPGHLFEALCILKESVMNSDLVFLFFDTLKSRDEIIKIIHKYYLYGSDEPEVIGEAIDSLKTTISHKAIFGMSKEELYKIILSYQHDDVSEMLLAILFNANKEFFSSLTREQIFVLIDKLVLDNTSVNIDEKSFILEHIRRNLNSIGKPFTRSELITLALKFTKYEDAFLLISGSTDLFVDEITFDEFCELLSSFLEFETPERLSDEFFEFLSGRLNLNSAEYATVLRRMIIKCRFERKSRSVFDPRAKFFFKHFPFPAVPDTPESDEIWNEIFALEAIPDEFCKSAMKSMEIQPESFKEQIWNNALKSEREVPFYFALWALPAPYLRKQQLLPKIRKLVAKREKMVDSFSVIAARSLFDSSELFEYLDTAKSASIKAVHTFISDISPERYDTLNSDEISRLIDRLRQWDSVGYVLFFIHALKPEHIDKISKYDASAILELIGEDSYFYEYRISDIISSVLDSQLYAKHMPLFAPAFMNLSETPDERQQIVFRCLNAPSLINSNMLNYSSIKALVSQLVNLYDPCILIVEIFVLIPRDFLYDFKLALVEYLFKNKKLLVGQAQIKKYDNIPVGMEDLDRYAKEGHLLKLLDQYSQNMFMETLSSNPSKIQGELELVKIQEITDCMYHIRCSKRF